MIYNWKQIVSRRRVAFTLGHANGPSMRPIQVKYVIVTARNTKADVLWLFRRLTDMFLPEQSGLNETNIDCP